LILCHKYNKKRIGNIGVGFDININIDIDWLARDVGRVIVSRWATELTNKQKESQSRRDEIIIEEIKGQKETPKGWHDRRTLTLTLALAMALAIGMKSGTFSFLLSVKRWMS